MPKNLFIVCFCVLLTLFACHSKREQSNMASKGMNNPENDQLEVNMMAFHLNDSVSQLFFEIKNENLLYKYSDTSLIPYSELRIIYSFYNLKDLKHAVDSGVVVIKDRAKEEQVTAGSIYGSVSLKARLGQSYRTHMEITDLNKKLQYYKQLDVVKQNPLSKQNFLVSEGDQLAFKSNFGQNTRVKIKVNTSLYDHLYVDCFLREFPIALPPFSTKEKQEFKLDPDSSFELSLVGSEAEIQFQRKGFYHLRLDDAKLEGLSLLSFDRAFPGVNNSEEMINCTRYIMTKDEYKSCKDAEDKKQAIDKFWLEIGGSNERARELLKKYYNRVMEANKNYTCYSQGWKTDRGMIYIVFGQPTSIVYNEDDEVWVYGSVINQTTNTFIFKKMLNPYTDNVYVLERSQFYKPAWSNAVDQWRQGIYYEGKR